MVRGESDLPAWASLKWHSPTPASLLRQLHLDGLHDFTVSRQLHEILKLRTDRPGGSLLLLEREVWVGAIGESWCDPLVVADERAEFQAAGLENNVLGAGFGPVRVAIGEAAFGIGVYELAIGINDADLVEHLVVLLPTGADQAGELVLLTEQ